MSNLTTGHIQWPHDTTPEPKTCDECFKFTTKELVQLEEGDWVCPDCLSRKICEECGKMSHDVTAILITCAELSDLVDLCPECTP